MGLKDYKNHLYDETTDGYIQIFKINDSKNNIKYIKFNDEIAEIIDEFENNEDIYITANTYYKEQRKVKNIRQFRALYQDLDIQKIGYSKEETVYLVYIMAYENKIPMPSLIVDSGQGIHLYWRIENAPYGALNTWQELQDYLYYQLKNLASDRRAIDGARLLRLPGTINSKNNSECKVLINNKDITYSMVDLREQYLNYKPKMAQMKIHQTKVTNTGSKVISNKFFNSYSLHLARAEDVETICRLRRYDLKGCRNAILHCYAYWKGIYVRDEAELGEIVHSLNNAFIEPLKINEVDAILRCIPKAINKFIEYEQGLRAGEVKRVSKGMRDKGGYWYKNETLIEIFKITKEEQKKLKTIISLDEKYDRNNKKRRDKRRNEDGLTSREQQKQDLINKVKALKSQGFKQKEVAEKLNKSLRTIKGYWN